MTITSKIDKTRNLTIYILIGSTTIDEIHGALKSFWEAHELTLNLLWDARSATLKNLRISDKEAQDFYWGYDPIQKLISKDSCASLRGDL